MSATPDERRWTSILSRITAGEPDTPLIQRVCEVSVELLDVSGAGICLVGGVRRQVYLYATDSVAQSLEDLQLTSARGPCIEAVRRGSPVMVPELRNYRSSDWQDYAEQALALGARAVFSFPVQAGDTQLGALDLYRKHPGVLTSDQAADALTIVHLLTRSLLEQRTRFGIDPTISALHHMTVADREPTPDSADLAVDLDVSVAQAFGAPPNGTSQIAGIPQ